MTYIIYPLLLIILLSCGGGESVFFSPGPPSQPAPPISPTENQFLPLDFMTSLNFGGNVTELSNGNVVITSSDFSVAPNNGGVFLFNTLTQSLIASVFGDDEDDFFGSSSITALNNGNFIIASENDDISGIANAGSVMLINGTTGIQIGTTITGDNVNDHLGGTMIIGRPSIIKLNNNNFVISSRLDDIGGISDAGSIMLINGTTGSQIGATIAGDNLIDEIGRSSITALNNSNFVIASSIDDVAGVNNAGSIMLINGTTGAQIGTTIAGNNENDQIGGSGVVELSNGNFVVSSSNDDVGGLINAGSVMLISGVSGDRIGPAISGDDQSDQFGSSGVTALSNGNFVVSSRNDDVTGLFNAGSVTLINGTTGAQIGARITGNDRTDQLGSSGIAALDNGNFVIASSNDDVGGLINAGSVMLMNGSNGSQVGSTIAGNGPGDRLGLSGIAALDNGNFVIASSNDDVSGVANAGSVMLINGTTGSQIGATISGNNIDDQIGNSGITVLDNGNFVIASRNDDVGGVIDAGSVMLINGVNGNQIGTTITGDSTDDQLGSSSITELNNGNFVIASQNDDVEGVINSGSIILINGINGNQIGATIFGDNQGDQFGSSSITALNNGDFIVSSEEDDVGGVIDAGSAFYRRGDE